MPRAIQVYEGNGAKPFEYTPNPKLDFRRFEYVHGTSSKFWEIKVTGCSHTVRYGRIGSKGQQRTKDFNHSLAAYASYMKLVEQKTGKGYAEV